MLYQCDDEENDTRLEILSPSLRHSLAFLEDSAVGNKPKTPIKRDPKQLECQNRPPDCGPIKAKLYKIAMKINEDVQVKTREISKLEEECRAFLFENGLQLKTQIKLFTDNSQCFQKKTAATKYLDTLKTNVQTQLDEAR